MAAKKGVFIMSKQIVNIGVPTLHCYDKLTRLCETLANDEHGRIVPRFAIVDNGQKLLQSEYLHRLQQLPISVEVFTPPRNLGVAASWNLLIQKLGRCIISNDDVVFTRSDAELLLNAGDEDDSLLFVGEQIGGWSLFLANRPEIWMEMGGFDENFYPAYYEDNDANYRLKIAGLRRKQIYLPSWTHENSSTLHTGSSEYQQAHWRLFAKNGSYYNSKWGGMPGQEAFIRPFNA